MTLRFSPNAAMRVYSKSSTYVANKGHESSWTDEGLLSGEWQGSFGDQALAAQAQGVNESARIRAYFHPDIYQKLKEAQCVIIKNDDKSAIVEGVPDKDNANCYELWGGVDNYKEADLYLEFRVRRYAGK